MSIARMWIFYIFCLLINWPSIIFGNVTTIRLYNSTSKIYDSTPNLSPLDRQGHKRDVVVVLPVMQGNTDLTNSNLQMLYTKTPVTAIINEHPGQFGVKDNKSIELTSIVSHIFPTTSPVPLHNIPITITTTSKMKGNLEDAIITAPLKKREDSQHTNTNYLYKKQTPNSHKSPLDYGYPESFKFVQELNELPKNHKPEWAQSDFVEMDIKKVTSTEKVTKGDPFQMFESVKPLEINKLLSLKPIVISVTDSIIEETVIKNKEENTEIPYHFIKKPPQFKRPSKKPQKIKPNPQKLNDAELAFYISSPTLPNKISSIFAPTVISTTSTPIINNLSTKPIASGSNMMGIISTLSPESDNDELYSAIRYSTLFTKSTKTFLPTPYTSSVDHVATIIRPIEQKPIITAPKPASIITTASTANVITTVVTTTTSPPSSNFNFTINATNQQSLITNTSSTTISPNFNWTNDGISSKTDPLQKNIGQIQPSDLMSLTKILGENFDSKVASIPIIKNIISTSTTTTIKPHFPADMLTADMKNMLVALGILKSDYNSTPFISITSTEPSINTEPFFNVFSKAEVVTPTIDPNSYLSFKKLPVDQKKSKVSNEMRDLLTSFGLLPIGKSLNIETNSTLIRISRQQKSVDKLNSPLDMFDKNMRQTMENLGLLKPMAYNLQPYKNGHIFQPNTHLEKLVDQYQATKINNALEIIRNISKNEDAQNLPIEELERKLQNITNSLHDNDFFKKNESGVTSSNIIKTTSIINENKNVYDNNTIKNNKTSITLVNNINPSVNIIDVNMSKVITTKGFDNNNKNKFISTNTNFSTKVDPSESGKINLNPTSNISYNIDTMLNPNFNTNITIYNINNTFQTTTELISDININYGANINMLTNSTKTSVIDPIITFLIMNNSVPQTKLNLKDFKNANFSTSMMNDLLKNLSSIEHNELNFSSDILSTIMSQLTQNNNNLNVIMNSPPNPLSMEESQNLLEYNKNDVKRQQPHEEVSLLSSTITVIDFKENNTLTNNNNNSSKKNDDDYNENVNNNTNIKNNTNNMPMKDESTNNAPLEALADSFGNENESEQTDNWLIKAKPNGLYFLLDWNTFLSVGEEDKNPIRIRFSPRAGNPRNFLPIKVP